MGIEPTTPALQRLFAISTLAAVASERRLFTSHKTHRRQPQEQVSSRLTTTMPRRGQLPRHPPRQVLVRRSEFTGTYIPGGSAPLARHASLIREHWVQSSSTSSSTCSQRSSLWSSSAVRQKRPGTRCHERDHSLMIFGFGPVPTRAMDGGASRTSPRQTVDSDAK